MNNIKKYIIAVSPIFMGIALIMASFSCRPELKDAVPNVTGVRYTSPDSTAPIASVGMGAVIAIQGSGLKDVQIVKFNSVEQTLNPNYITDNNIVVTVPGYFPTEITNQFCLITASGMQYCFDFEIEIPGPVIDSARYQITSAELPDIIYLEGNSFAEIVSLTIGTPDQIANGTATEISGYQVNPKFTMLAYYVPGNFELNQTEIVMVCVAGSDTMSVDWEGLLKPSVDSISNEYAMIGDTTVLFGKNLASVESVSFGGTTVTDYWESDDYETLKLLVPEGATPGMTTISVSNFFGEGSITFRYADTDHMLIDFDDNPLCWGGVDSWDMAVINGDTNKWCYFRGDIAPLWWDQNNVMARCDAEYPIFSSVSDPMNKIALKFEIDVRKPWSGGGMCKFSFQQFVADNKGGNSDQEMIYYEWVPEFTNENPYTTDGWLTITIPLSDFEISSDYGSQLDPTAFKNFWLRFFNPGDSEVTLIDMDVNVDNLRLEIME